MKAHDKTTNDNTLKAGKDTKFGQQVLKAHEAEIELRTDSANQSENLPEHHVRARQPFVFSEKQVVKPIRRPFMHRAMQTIGVLLTFAWVALSALYVDKTIGWSNLGTFLPHELGGFLAGVLTPIALYWMVLAFVMRSSDVQMYAEALRGELQAMIFPTEDAEVRINNDIEMLMRQSVEMQKGAKVAVESIGEARQMLNEDIRKYTQMTNSASAHLSGLSHSMNAQGDTLLAKIKQLEESVNAIENRAQSGTKAWDNATAKVLDRINNIETALDKGADNVLVAAAKADEKTQSIHDYFARTAGVLDSKTEEVLDRLTRAFNKFAGQSETLDDIRARIDESGMGLSSTMREHSKEMDFLVQQMSDIMQKSGEKIASEREGLLATAEKAAEKAGEVASQLQKGTGALYAVTDDALDKAKLVENRLIGQVTALEAALKAMDNQGDKIEESSHIVLEAMRQSLTETMQAMDEQRQKIADASDATTESLREAMESANKGAGALRMNLQAAVDDLASAALDGSERADIIMTELDSRITKLDGLFDNSLNSMDDLIDVMDSRQKQVIETGTLAEQSVDKMRSIIDGAIARIAQTTHSLTSQLGGMKEAFSQPLAEVEEATDATAQRTQAMADILSAKVAQLLAAGETIGNQTSSLSDGLKNQADYIVELSDKVSGHSQAISGKLLEDKDLLDKAVTDAIDRIGEIALSVNSQRENMENTGLSVVETLKGYEAVLDGRYNQLTSQSDSLKFALSSLTEDMSGKAATIESVSGKVIDRVSTMNENIAAQNEQIIQVSNSFAVRADSVQSNLQGTKESFVSFADDTLHTLEKTSDKYREILLDNKSAADSVIEMLDTATDGLSGKIDAIGDAAHNAKDEVQLLAGTLENSAQDIHLAVNQAAVRVEKVRDDIQLTYDDVNRIIDGGQERLENVNITFAKVFKDIEDKGEGMVTNFTDISNKLKSRFDETGEKVISRFDEVDAKLSNHLGNFENKVIHLSNSSREATDTLVHLAQQLDSNTNATVADLEKAATVLQAKAGAIRDELSQTISSVGQLSGKMKTEMDTIVTISEDTVSKVTGAADKLLTQGDAIDLTGTNLFEKLQRVTAGMTTQTTTMVNSADKVNDKTAKTVLAMTRQVQDLERASEKALEIAEKIKEKDARIRRESFLSSTKFVVESLHSLSVDFTRMMEGELPDKTWKSYQKGDTGAFTRRLVSIKDTISSEKIRAKFAEDVEFRTYMQRYLRQFEEIYDQARQADHADLLTTVFLSSDVGKLYGMICKLLGRDMRGAEIADKQNVA